MSWAHYILQVNIYLVIFYGFYKLLLDKETYFVMNRIYLLFAGLLSLSIPFLRFEWFRTQSAVQPIYTGVVQLNEFIAQAGIAQDAPEALSPGKIIVLIYLAGVVCFTLKFTWQLLAVRSLLKKINTGNAFTFFNKKRIDQDLPQVQVIDKHEEIHIRQLHTLDVLFFEMVNIFTWFNPIIYLYKHTIKNIHEYLADEEAAKFQGDKEQYALLLLSNAFGISPNSLTNTFFNKSLIKKRIFMLHKERSRKTAILKYGLFLPLFAITLIMSSATIRNNEEILTVAEAIPLDAPISTVKEIISRPVVGSGNIPTMINHQKPLNADWQSFYNFIRRVITYPKLAKKEGIYGYSQVKFKIKNGQVEELSTVKKLGGGCDTEVMKSLLAYEGFKASQDGNYTLKVKFDLPDASKKGINPGPLKGYTPLNEIVVTAYNKANPPIEEGKDKIHDFVSVDTQPTFPGGMAFFYSYLKKSVKYPEEAQKEKIQGKVFLSFIVETDGTLTNITVERRLGGGTDEEAIRVLKESPKWIPGTLNSAPVRVKYNIPISFNLNKGTEKPAGEAKKDQSGGDNDTSDDKNNIVLLSSNEPNQPLVYVDGKKTSIAETQAIHPDQIQSIEVLSKVSAFKTYGPEGRNGVLLVKTKTDSKSKKAELIRKND